MNVTSSQSPQPQVKQYKAIVDEPSHDYLIKLEGYPQSENFLGKGMIIGGEKYLSGSIHEVDPKESDEAARKKREAFFKVGMNTSAIIGQLYPEIEGPISGIELVFSTGDTFFSWRHKKPGEWKKPTLKTIKALVESLNVFVSALPNGEQFKQYTKLASIIVKTADSVYTLDAAFGD